MDRITSKPNVEEILTEDGMIFDFPFNPESQHMQGHTQKSTIFEVLHYAR